MKVSVGTAQWIGERKRQEDSLAYAVGADGRHLFVLGDGMGGHAGGDIASRLATSVALEALLNPYDTIPDSLAGAISRANSAITDYVETSPECDGMGTTLICAVVENGKLWWSSVGDSHLYLFRNGDVKKINADHSMMPVLQKMVSEGEITAEQAASDPKRNALRSAVMGDDIPLVDVSKRPFDLRPGDTIILCSDGLDSIEKMSSVDAVVASKDDAEITAISLIDATKEVNCPRQDNTSVIVVKVGGDGVSDKVNQAEVITPEISENRNFFRRLILPACTVALAIATLWFAFSSWKAEKDLESFQDRVSELTAEKQTLTEQLGITNQTDLQLGEAREALSSISTVIAHSGDDIKKLSLLKEEELTPQGLAIVDFITASLSEKQSLLEQISDDRIRAEIKKRALSEIRHALNSDSVSEELEALIPDLEDKAVQALAQSILDQLSDAETRARQTLQESEELSQRIIQRAERLSGLKSALEKDTLRIFVEQNSDTVEAEIAKLLSDILRTEQVNNDPADASGHSND